MKEQKPIYGYLIYAVLLSVLLIINSSCSSSDGKKILSIFFDGVPQAKKEKPAADSLLVSNENKQKPGKINKRVAQQIFYHPPYRTRACAKCHNLQAGNDLIKQPPKLCYTCHDNFKNKFAVLHGPVASGYCTQCHNPHSTKIPKLLERKGQKLCLYCHEKKDVFKNEVHEDINNTDCTDCHDPHGGDDRFLL